MSSSDSWAAPADDWASLYSDLSLCVDDETQWISLYANSVPLENYWTPVDRIILGNEEVSENDGTPEHHYGPASTPFTLDIDTQEIHTVDNQLVRVDSAAYIERTLTFWNTQDNYINCPKTLCLHTDPNGDECFEPINCGTMPDHFRDKHDMKGLGRSHPLVCITTSVTSASVTSTMIGILLTNTKLLYALGDELGGSTTATGSAAALWKGTTGKICLARYSMRSRNPHYVLSSCFGVRALKETLWEIAAGGTPKTRHPANGASYSSTTVQCCIPSALTIGGKFFDCKLTSAPAKVRYLVSSL
ncbi:hypothetical protein F5J12DRAFT_781838 [Pisolithus orientalis]|uniref:uncharacterized protein n=1 Tax=Pisolithus orientalis TaxID=936130 RepID=UPI002224C472|nr:uncharacterized protein F5J12DRAFT_781838 [Pisolithus orientalis]KAI6010866.1 hypothetical protein F5J12DRAFT_781838 [Pisolithus orientalis]